MEGGGAGIEIYLSTVEKVSIASKPDCTTTSKYINQWYSKEDYCRGHVVNNPNKIKNVDHLFDDDVWYCPICGDEGNDDELCNECGEVEHLMVQEPIPGFCPRCGTMVPVGLMCVKCPKHHKTGLLSDGRSFKPDRDITIKVGLKPEENLDLQPYNKHNTLS